MTNTLNIPPHERVKLLRKGEKVLCKKCKTGDGCLAFQG